MRLKCQIEKDRRIAVLAGCPPQEAILPAFLEAAEPRLHFSHMTTDTELEWQ
jgi:hypothetical protein